MAQGADWTKDAFERSVTARGWTYSDYDGGWDSCKDCAEIRGIYEEEMSLGGAPGWAREVVRRMLASPLPPCGHYTFPRPIIQTCEAIGQERCPEFVIGCYTAEPQRRALLAYYVFCLDSWLQGAPLDVAQAELAMRSGLGKDWGAICADIHDVLGERTDLRSLLVERLVHRLRWWVKTLIWDGSGRDQFMLDSYLGDVRGDGQWGDYGNTGYADPYFAELRAPGVAEMSARIRAEVPNGERLLTWTESTWLCAPKAFRYVERILLAAGALGTDAGPDFARSVLDCEDTYPDFASQQRWFEAFLRRLAAWLDGDGASLPELGVVTPTKHWLARMLRLRLANRDPRSAMAGGPRGRPGRAHAPPA
jgi:hypothetical protein